MVPQHHRHADGLRALDPVYCTSWTFYGTVVFAIGYCVAYPSLPSANGQPDIESLEPHAEVERVVRLRDA